jgi:hypothetical protein
MKLPVLDFDPWRRTPLERMYDVWLPGWEQYDKPRIGLVIYAANDFTRHGRTCLANEPITCRLCGGSDGWRRESRAFVCEHGTVEGLEIRRIDSIPLALVGEVNETQE